MTDGRHRRLATALDLPAIETLLQDHWLADAGDGVVWAMGHPSARVVVTHADGARPDGLAVVTEGPIGPGSLRVHRLLGADQDGLLVEAGWHARHMGAAALVHPDGTAHELPEVRGTISDRFLALAARAANAALLAANRTAGVGAATTKDDGSPSAEADAAADRESQRILAALGVPMLSEERTDIGVEDPSGPWLVVDPIDGTGNYRAGVPPWAFSAGLVAGGRPVAGYVMDLSSGRRWWGTVDVGSFRDGRPVTTSPGSTLVIPTPPPGGTAAVPDGFRRLRITGCTAVDLCLVADGSAGAWHDLDRDGTHVHDVAGALAVLVAAGGVVLDPDGQRLELRPDTEGLIRFVAAANHDTATGLLVGT